jgi:beta-glucosidase
MGSTSHPKLEVWKRYQTPIYITEHGLACSTEAQQKFPQMLKDQHRSVYHLGYLDAMKEAVVEDGVDVRS